MCAGLTRRCPSGGGAFWVPLTPSYKCEYAPMSLLPQTWSHDHTAHLCQVSTFSEVGLMKDLKALRCFFTLSSFTMIYYYSPLSQPLPEISNTWRRLNWKLCCTKLNRLIMSNSHDPWTAATAPLSSKFSKQEYWKRVVPCSEDLPFKDRTHVSPPALWEGSYARP